MTDENKKVIDFEFILNTFRLSKRISQCRNHNDLLDSYVLINELEDRRDEYENPKQFDWYIRRLRKELSAIATYNKLGLGMEGDKIIEI